MSWCSRADLDDLLQHLARVERAGGVVGVDDDDGLGVGGDLRAYVIDVRVPVGLLVAKVVDGLAACEVDACGPKRVVGGRDQHLVAVVQKGVHRDGDELRDAVAGVDVVHLDVGNALDLVVLHDGLAGGEEAPAVRIALGLAQLACHVLDDLVGGAEAEGRGVADVELQHVRAALLHAVGLLDHGTTHVVQDVIELV